MLSVTMVILVASRVILYGLQGRRKVATGTCMKKVGKAYPPSEK